MTLKKEKNFQQIVRVRKRRHEKKTNISRENHDQNDLPRWSQLRNRVILRHQSRLRRTKRRKYRKSSKEREKMQIKGMNK